MGASRQRPYCARRLSEKFAGDRKIFKTPKKKLPNQAISIENACSDVKAGNKRPSLDREPILCDFIIFFDLVYFFGLHPSPTHPPGGAPAGPCEKKIFCFASTVYLFAWLDFMKTLVVRESRSSPDQHRDIFFKTSNMRKR